MVTGVLALRLHAYSGLGRRDVRSILANSARHVGTAVSAGVGRSELLGWGWNDAQTWNGGVLHFSNDYSYGLVNALAAARPAETGLPRTMGNTASFNEEGNVTDMLNATVVIRDGNLTGTA